MRLRALQMPIAVWLLFATVLTAGTVGGSIRLLRPADDVTWRAIPSSAPTARVARRAAVAPASSGRGRSKVAGRAEERKAAAMLLLLMLGGRDRLAAVSR